MGYASKNGWELSAGLKREREKDILNGPAGPGERIRHRTRLTTGQF